MKHTLWLYDVLKNAIADEKTLIGNTLRLVCASLSVDGCALWLNESDGPSDTVLLFQDGACEAVSPDETALCGGRSFEMNSKVACRFGRFFVPNEAAPFSKKSQEAFSLFCELLYTEFMCGFFESDAPAALEVENVVMNYGAREQSPNVLNGVSFTIHRGQLTVLMGASGCGKSTMLNVMGGLLKPTSGAVQYKGENVCDFSKRQMNEYRRNAMGFIFQNYNLIADLTVGENVGIARSLADCPADTQEMLNSVGVGQYIDHYPFRLSGGEQQRVCIARALVKNADILLCDEPTGALDTENSKTIMTLLQQKAKERNTAVVVVTHNPEFEAIADHYIKMRNGAVILDEYRPFPYGADEFL